MSSNGPRSNEERSSFCLENLFHLLSYRSLDEMLSEALSLLIAGFEARGGSIVYFSVPTKRFQQGQLNDLILQYIQHWEDTTLERMRERAQRARLPHLAPVTRHTLPGQSGCLLSIPLIGHDEICGALSLAFRPTPEITAQQEATFVQCASGISAIATSIEQLVLTRQRLNQLGLFYQMGQSVASAFDVDRLFQDTIDLAVTVLDAEGAILMLIDPQTRELVPKSCLGGPTFLEGQRVPLGKGVAGWVAEHGVPLLLNNAAQDTRFDPVIDGCHEFPTQSVLCVPLLIKGQVIGTLEVLNKMPRPGFTDEDLSVLITLAAQAAIATENARLYHDLRAERDRIIEAQENVRRELARNMHDGPVQLLAALSMRLETLERLNQVQPEAVPDELDALKALARHAMQDARMLLFELRPVILETQGLVSALQSYVERLASSGRFTPHFEASDSTHRLDPRIEGTIFSIVQEAITNIEKHANARNIWIRLQEENDELIVSIEDDGKGFNIQSIQARYDKGASFGLLNMRERADLIDGVLTVESGPKRGKPGTLVQLRLELPKAEEIQDGRASNG